MEVAFRVDASTYIGSGHVMRCLVLADELKRQGHGVCFYTRPQSGDLVELIRSRGHQVRLLVQPKEWMKPTNSSDYAAWLQIPQIEDADNFVNLCTHVNVVVIDHYGIGSSWHTYIREKLSCKIVAVDDLVREHNADLIIDQTILRQAQEYKVKNINARVMSGTKFSILDPKFHEFRKSRVVANKVLPKRPKLLITMGGIDEPNATLKVLQELKSGVDTLPQVTVLLSKRAPHYQLVNSFANQNPTWITHIEFVDDMAALMLEHDIAIGAAGSTSWERACLGLPSIVVPLADNQRTICTNLVKVGAALSFELSSLSELFNDLYHSLINNYETIRAASLAICDGEGIQRIMKEINALQMNQLKLRNAASSDIQQVYDWQCEPETRRYALNKSTPTFEEHQAWMSRKLESENDFFYLIEWREQNSQILEQVGVVRLDEASPSVFTISIFISPDYFGKGIAKQALQEIDKLHPDITINATVLKDNKASQALFSRAGYTRIDEEHFVRVSSKEV